MYPMNKRHASMTIHATNGSSSTDVVKSWGSPERLPLDNINTAFNYQRYFKHENNTIVFLKTGIYRISGNVNYWRNSDFGQTEFGIWLCRNSQPVYKYEQFNETTYNIGFCTSLHFVPTTISVRVDDYIEIVHNYGNSTQKFSLISRGANHCSLTAELVRELL